MNKIQEVKERANILNVAGYFNIELNRANKGICPFHKENTASFSIHPKKQIWKCFGCGKGGDVISLVQELLNINAYEAAKQINQICGCGVDFNAPISKYEIEKYKQKQKIKEEFNLWIDNAYDILTEYYKYYTRLIRLCDKVDYFDNMEFIQALKNKDKIEAWIDILYDGTDEEKIWFWKTYRKEVENLGGRLRRKTT